MTKYKKWKKKFDKENTIGLGDIVEKVTTATGIKKAVKFIAGEDCGCEERKNKMNSIPILKKKECKLFNRIRVQLFK